MLEKYQLEKVAYLKKPFGIKGELNSQLLVSDAQDLQNLPTLYISDDISFIFPTWLKGVRKTPGQYILSFNTIATRSEAERFRGCHLVCPHDNLSYLSSHHRNWQLLQVEVFDVKKGRIGVIKSIVPTPAHDILFTMDEGGQEFYIPYQEEYIVSYSSQKRVVTVDLPENLLQGST